jgi:hypothetical protein
MKVRVEGPHPVGQKWRGLALDHFDGISWSCSQPDRSRIPTQGGYFKLRESAIGSSFLVQTFFLEPIATNIVFGAHQVLAVSTDLGVLERDASDNIYSQSPRTGTVRYSVVSDSSQPDPMRRSPAGSRPVRRRPTTGRGRSKIISRPATTTAWSCAARRIAPTHLLCSYWKSGGATANISQRRWR